MAKDIKRPKYPIAPLGSPQMEKYLKDMKTFNNQPKRNFKLWNHWIAEVRDIAKENKVHFSQTEDENGRCKQMGKSHLKYYFGKDSMEDYFNDGLTPQEAFEEEISYWE